MTRDHRPLDLILWGATGYTGRLVAEYLAHQQDNQARPLRWALAGRDARKLEAVRTGLGRINPACAKLEVLTGDARDPVSLDALAARTRAICTTVGPYAQHGSGLVGACARAGTDYCDITGEVHWVRRMIDQHHEEAQKSGARIVHCCGFDSIPSDLGVLMVHEAMQAQHGRRCSSITSFFQMKGGPSGGTAATMVATLAEAGRDPQVRRVLGNPYSLDPSPGRRGPDGRDGVKIAWDSRIRQWTGPFVMAATNTRIVRRSNALLGHAYGDDFRYTELASYGGSVGGLLGALGVTAGLGAFAASMQIPLLRDRVAAWLPSPGEGPTQEEREAGFFKVRLWAESDPPGILLEATVGDHLDPGYGSTARMLGESALSLALDDLPAGGGVLTPATALGMPLVERLRRTGLTFRIEA